MSYFLTKTIAQLLTPPTETASTSPAPTTERSGEELLSVLSDAVDVAAILSSTTAPTTELLVLLLFQFHHYLLLHFPLFLPGLLLSLAMLT